MLNIKRQQGYFLLAPQHPKIETKKVRKPKIMSEYSTRFLKYSARS